MGNILDCSSAKLAYQALVSHLAQEIDLVIMEGRTLDEFNPLDDGRGIATAARKLFL